MTAPGRRDGVFVSRRALVIGGCATAGLLVTVLVMLLPQLGTAIGTGVAAAGLIYVIAAGWSDER